MVLSNVDLPELCTPNVDRTMTFLSDLGSNKAAPPSMNTESNPEDENPKLHEHHRDHYENLMILFNKMKVEEDVDVQVSYYIHVIDSLL